MKNKFSIPFEVDKNGKFLISKDDREALNSFNSAHPGQQGQMTLEIYSGDRARRHWQHRKYRADILPAISEIYGEPDIDYFHEWVLKPKFCTHQITDVKELPSRYIAGKRKGRFNFITNTVDGQTEKLIEYIPSTAAFTIEEMDEYIKNCKQLLEGLQSAGSLEEIQERMS